MTESRRASHAVRPVSADSPPSGEQATQENARVSSAPPRRREPAVREAGALGLREHFRKRVLRRRNR